MTSSLKHAALRRRIEEIGIIPSIRTQTADSARFAAETVAEAGIPIVEITMTVPDALRVIGELRRQAPNLIVGADSSWDLDSARRAVDAGAMFVTSPGLDTRSILEFVIQGAMVVIPGALTPSELSEAWQAGADFVKVFPCHSMGGPRYIRSLRAPFPAIPLKVFLCCVCVQASLSSSPRPLPLPHNSSPRFSRPALKPFRYSPR